MKKLLKRHKHFWKFLFTILTIPVVLIVQEFDFGLQYELNNYLLATIVIMIVCVEGYIQYNEYEAEKEDKDKRKVEKKNENARTVLSKIIQLVDRKAGNYRENTYDLVITDKEWPYFYGIHSYLHEVCENLRCTVSDIINAEIDYVDVSLIYRYCAEEEWKWLAGKSGISDAVNLNEFVRNPETLYYYILNHKEQAPIFCNDKSKSSIYKLGRRDNLFEGKGSFYAMPITFSNNKEPLVEAILLISTYGVNFIASSKGKDEENEFRRILAYDVVPYYISVIQSELGALYLRHNLNQIKYLPKNT